MRRSRNRVGSALIGAVVSTTLLIPAVTDAATTPPVLGKAPMVASSRDGRLSANGQGSVTIQGGPGFTKGLLRNGVITVRDRAGDAVLKVGPKTFVPGRRRANRNVIRVQVRQARVFLVLGSDVQISVNGRRIVLSVTGKYGVRLEGTGSYRINGGDVGSWDGSDLSLSGDDGGNHGRGGREN